MASDRPNRIVGIELVRLRLPLEAPWITAHGSFSHKQVVLSRVVLRTSEGEVEGWGECGALPEPTYSSEHAQGALEVMSQHLVPRLLSAPVGSAAEIGAAFSDVKGHQMAKSCLEMAVLDAELRAKRLPLALHLAQVSSAGARPRQSVPAGAVVSISSNLDDLLAGVEERVSAGYRRVKLKIEPGWDYEPLRAVRSSWPTLALMADANGSYAPLRDNAAERLARMDDIGLVCIEQPLADEDMIGHAALSRRISTPICLDEAISSTDQAITALELGACAVVNIKAARVGGYLNAVQIHDACMERGVPVWCGGMLETGVGRSANVALASLPNFTIPGDISTGRFGVAEIARTPQVQVDGTMPVPDEPGVGAVIDQGALAAAVTYRHWSYAQERP